MPKVTLLENERSGDVSEYLSRLRQAPIVERQAT